MTADAEWDRFAQRVAAAPDPVVEIRRHQTAEWESGGARRVEEYLTRFPNLTDEDALVLIFAEVALRRARGESPDASEYRARFPRLAEDIAVQFGFQKLLVTTAEPPRYDPTTDQLNKTQPQLSDPPEPAPQGVPGYDIERELGRGGMGVVYLARQHGLNRTVALKMILSTARDPKLVIRFLAEAEAVAAVHHPNVVEVYQFGEHAGRPYLALEYCPNGSLADKLAKGPLPPAEAVATLATVAEGVAAAHAAGIVHRDLKPANVLIAADGTPKVTDFGLAKRFAGDSAVTNTNAMVGTPAYMAPEQARGEARFVGPATDVWALGAMLYELVSGRRPFEGDDTWRVIEAAMRGQFPPLRTVAPAAPRDLELICAKCLSLDPRDRYAGADELAKDLRRLAAGEPVSVRPPGSVERAVRWVRRNKVVAGATAAVVVALAGGLIGTAIGLVRADDARIRAEGAERDARDRLDEWVRADEARRRAEAGLAEGYVQTAELALQRGAWRAALYALDRARAAGYPDHPRLRLYRVRALVAIHDVTAAATELRALAERTDLGDLRGPALLWQADLALARATDQAGRDLVSEARRHKLPPADEAYAQGLLAKTVPDALTHFRRAVELDSFHHRASGMAVVLLVALGRMGEARVAAELGGHLFPEDPTFGVLVGLVDAWEGRSAEAGARLNRLGARLGERQLAAAKALFALAEEARRLEVRLSGTANGGFAIFSFVAKAIAACQSIQDLREDGSLLLPVPPVLEDGLVRMGRSVPLASLSKNGPAKGIDALRETSVIYPNGLVSCVLGIVLATAGRYEDAEPVLRAAVDGPSFVPVRRPGLFALTYCHWQIAERLSDPKARKERLGRSVEMARELRAYRALTEDEVRLVASVADAADEPLLAREIVADWDRRTGMTDLTMLRLWAKAEFHLGADDAAIALVKRLLKVQPNDGVAKFVLAGVEKRLKSRLESIQGIPPKP